MARPFKVRPELPEVRAAMRIVRQKRSEIERLEAEAREIEFRVMMAAWQEHSLEDIAQASGLTRARIHQIVRRGQPS